MAIDDEKLKSLLGGNVSHFEAEEQLLEIGKIFFLIRNRSFYLRKAIM